MSRRLAAAAVLPFLLLFSLLLIFTSPLIAEEQALPEAPPGPQHSTGRTAARLTGGGSDDKASQSRGAEVVALATVTVCKAGPPTCDYATIQAAVNAANANDTVDVAAGIYTEAGITVTKSLTIRAPAGLPPPCRLRPRRLRPATASSPLLAASMSRSPR